MELTGEGVHVRPCIALARVMVWVQLIFERAIVSTGAIWWSFVIEGGILSRYLASVMLAEVGRCL